MQKHQNALKTIKVASGQIQSVAKMIEEDRYCMDISMQIQATEVEGTYMYIDNFGVGKK